MKLRRPPILAWDEGQVRTAEAVRRSRLGSWRHPPRRVMHFAGQSGLGLIPCIGTSVRCGAGITASSWGLSRPATPLSGGALAIGPPGSPPPRGSRHQRLRPSETVVNAFAGWRATSVRSICPLALWQPHPAKPKSNDDTGSRAMSGAPSADLLGPIVSLKHAENLRSVYPRKQLWLPSGATTLACSRVTRCHASR
jgi:hypothetical protein